MALTWTGEDEVETVIGAWEATSAFATDDPEAVVAALFSALVEALFQGQNSGNPRVRWAEALVNSDGDRCAPITAMEIMNLATKAHLIRAELAQVASGPTAAQANAAAEGDNYDTASLAPAH
jgi:hypothetical protein